jgi:hypothetical protein
MRALARDLQNRYSSAEQFRVALQRAGAGTSRDASGQFDRFPSTGMSAVRAPRPPMAGGASSAGDWRSSAQHPSASSHRGASRPGNSPRDVPTARVEAQSRTSDARAMMQLPPRSLGVTRQIYRVSPGQSPANPPLRRESAATSRTAQRARQVPPDGYRGRETRGYHGFDFPVTGFGDATLAGYGDATNARHSASYFGLLFALAAIVLVVAGFGALSLLNGLGGGQGANAHGPGAASTPSDVPYVGLAATATTYALTPTVTTGPHTPTPTPRPPVPTPTRSPIPTVTTGPGTPTPTAAPPTPTPTPTPAPPTPTPTDTPTPIPTDTPTPIPTETPTP